MITFRASETLQMMVVFFMFGFSLSYTIDHWPPSTFEISAHRTKEGVLDQTEFNPPKQIPHCVDVDGQDFEGICLDAFAGVTFATPSPSIETINALYEYQIWQNAIR